ncbi:helix-turn-helix domain-containing protein [Salipaludibacillus aurantiacus]|uniref:Helix-turn-helix domain-containing protein n=1 Tax=Salipaludibacillus aurantiacus TaxID=1601833 RepID=A0A1H9WHW3_9BACI|nr:helix-turn-helix domain-containing protein [Salipaludibacillus aurantiacus]SES33411.1 Helix-turn-helix domain-containing protein [Salipaludibacillus aurantiacus]
MKQSKGDVILHPIRIKILKALARKPMTVQEMIDCLQNIPQATLYRHLKVLRNHQIVEVEEEKQVRGTLEKRYTLNGKNAHMSGEEAKNITKEEHSRYFMMYAALIIKQLEEYLDGDIDIEKDGFGYTQIDLQLNEEDNLKFLEEYRELVEKYCRLSSDGARKRTLSTIMIPEKNIKGSEENE